jgi:hypothetical protein
MVTSISLYISLDLSRDVTLIFRARAHEPAGSRVYSFCFSFGHSFLQLTRLASIRYIARLTDGYFLLESLRKCRIFVDQWRRISDNLFRFPLTLRAVSRGASRVRGGGRWNFKSKGRQ